MTIKYFGGICIRQPRPHMPLLTPLISWTCFHRVHTDQITEQEKHTFSDGGSICISKQDKDLK